MDVSRTFVRLKDFLLSDGQMLASVFVRTTNEILRGGRDDLVESDEKLFRHPMDTVSDRDATKLGRWKRFCDLFTLAATGHGWICERTSQHPYMDGIVVWMNARWYDTKAYVAWTFCAKSYARSVRAEGCLYLVNVHLTRLADSVAKTHEVLRKQAVEMDTKRVELLSAETEFSILFESKLDQRREATLRSGREFKYDKRDVVTWFTDPCDVDVVLRLKTIKGEVERLKKRMNSTRKLLDVVGEKRAEFQSLVGDYELSKDFQTIGLTIDDAEGLNMTSITQEILKRVFETAERVERTVDSVSKEMTDQAFDDVGTVDVRDAIMEIVGRIETTPLGTIPLGTIPLTTIPLTTIPLTTTPLGPTPLAA